MTIIPCPFCACGDVGVVPLDSAWIVACRECGVEGPHAMTEDEAVRKWNVRHVFRTPADAGAPGFDIS